MSERDGAVLERTFGGHQYTIRDVLPDDQPEVSRLFVEAFGHQPGRDWYEWKYAAGRSGALGLWDETGHLRAHYAGIPRTIAWQGNQVAGLQIGDVMVSPAIRGLMLRHGPFQQVCSHFFATRVGAGRPFRFAWGFPNQRHLRLGITLGLYHDAGVISELNWPAKRPRSSPWWYFSPLDPNASDFDSQVDAAWGAMARDLKHYVVGIRDSRYVRWRFLARPDRQYRLFGLRRRLTGTMVACAVMRFEDGTAELLDVIGPRSAFAQVVRASLNEAVDAGVTALKAWASAAVVELARDTGAAAAPSEATLAISSGSDLSDEEITSARWWLMGGDTDFL